MPPGPPWNKAMNTKMMNTKMTRSEKFVTGLAVAVLVAGFATGVFAKPVNPSPHVSARNAHMTVIQAERNN